MMLTFNTDFNRILSEGRIHLLAPAGCPVQVGDKVKLLCLDDEPIWARFGTVTDYLRPAAHGGGSVWMVAIGEEAPIDPDDARGAL